MEKTTKYAGWNHNGKIIVIATENDGKTLRTVPHVSMMKGKALLPATIDMKADFVKKHNVHYLTKHEVSCFMKGTDIDGNILKTPEEEQKEALERQREYLKTDEGKEFIRKLKESNSEFAREVLEKYRKDGLI